MNSFFDISRRIPKNPLQNIILLIIVAGGGIGFRILMEEGVLDAAWSKVLFLVVLLIVFLILFMVEHKNLSGKTGPGFTKKELGVYLRVNYLITCLAFVIFTLILFLF